MPDPVWRLGRALAALALLALASAQYISPTVAAGKNRIINIGLLAPLNANSSNTLMVSKSIDITVPSHSFT
jgi:hypothetical protein